MNVNEAVSHDSCSFFSQDRSDITYSDKAYVDRHQSRSIFDVSIAALLELILAYDRSSHRLFMTTLWISNPTIDCNYKQRVKYAWTLLTPDGRMDVMVNEENDVCDELLSDARYELKRYGQQKLLWNYYKIDFTP